MMLKANKGLQMRNLSAVQFLQVKSATDLTMPCNIAKDLKIYLKM